MLDDAGSAPNAALRISQTELASMLGVSRERVNRQLVAWANSGSHHDRRRWLYVTGALWSMSSLTANGA